MMSSNALSRTPLVTQDNQRVVQAPLGEIVASKIALAWIDTLGTTDALIEMNAGFVPFRAVPSVQNSFAAICADLMSADMRVSCCGFQAYSWMVASGMPMTDVMRAHLGKILCANVVAMSAEDIAASMKKGPMQIVALHVENAQGWQDVRQISAAAVKAETPILLLISAEIPAPEGVVLDVVRDWNDGARMVRDAFVSVRDKGAIRLVAMDDMPSAVIEAAMIEAAGMTPQGWADAIAKNDVAVQAAMNAAYMSPVESF